MPSACILPIQDMDNIQNGTFEATSKQAAALGRAFASFTPISPSSSSCWYTQRKAVSSAPRCVRTRCTSSYLPQEPLPH